MEETLVTIAIHTPQKAEQLRQLLEQKGIAVFIQDVDSSSKKKPESLAGVRVRIKMTDLEQALNIIETNKATQQQHSEENKVLIPVDFSDYSVKACDFGFKLSQLIGAEIILLHTYFNPVYGSYVFSDSGVSGGTDSDTLVNIQNEVNKNLEKLKLHLESKIEQGILPNIKFECVLREGVPEEEIINYSNSCNPSFIVMGTRGHDKKDSDLIGSVTAEVIEQSSYPVFVIPEKTSFSDFSTVKNIAYTTNFGQRDLIAFEKVIQYLKPFDFKISFVHIQQKFDMWNEIKLAGIKEYFKANYPNIQMEYHLINNEDILSAFDKFITDNKIDLITLNSHKRNIFARFFNPSLSRKMVFHSETPMLIFHK